MHISVLLYTRRNCPLCQEVESQLNDLAARFPLVIEYRDVDADARLRMEYGTRVPAVFIDGEERFRYRIDPLAFERLVLERSTTNDDQT